MKQGHNVWPSRVRSENVRIDGRPCWEELPAKLAQQRKKGKRTPQLGKRTGGGDDTKGMGQKRRGAQGAGSQERAGTS